MNQQEFFEKVKMAISRLERGLVGRGLECRLVLLAVLTGENSLLIGPPGTAKSELAKRLHTLIDIPQDMSSNNFDDSGRRNLRRKGYFEILLTGFSTPEEVLGPLSIPKLQNSVYERTIEGYLPSAYIAFLDEIFKANSTILNALLTIVNEREFDNGAIRHSVPLLSVVAASNELPREEGELAALYDRFLVRLWVDNLDDKDFVPLLGVYDKSFRQLNVNNISEIRPLFSLTELKELKESLNNVILPEFVKNYLAIFRTKLAKMNEGIRQRRGQAQNINIYSQEDTSFREAYVSERRWGKIVKLLKASAWLNNRNYVSLWDLLLLHECIASTKDHVVEFPLQLLVDWTEVINRSNINIPSNLPAEQDLAQLDNAKLNQLKDRYQSDITRLTSEFSSLRDLVTALDNGFNEEDNAAKFNIWLTPSQFKNRLIEWGKYCSQSNVIEEKLNNLKQKLQQLSPILELLNRRVQGGTTTIHGDVNGNGTTTIYVKSTGITITCLVGGANIVFAEMKDTINDRLLYISELPITSEMVNDIENINTRGNANQIITRTIPQITELIERINQRNPTSNVQNCSLRLPTKEEWIACVLANFPDRNRETVLSKLKEDWQKICRRGTNLNDQDWLREVQSGNKQLSFCPHLKSPVGYQPQLCSHENKYILMGGDRNSSMEEMCTSILKGTSIQPNDNTSFAFRLILELN